MKSDLIYRQDAIDEFKSYGKRVDTATQLWTIMGCAEIIRNLPSAQPERMPGKWVNYGEGECCDQCGRYPYDDGEFHILGWRSNFCPHCGADMRGDTDDGTD